MAGELKTCTRCGEAKPLSAFYSNGREGPGRVGLHAACKTCMNQSATANNRRKAARHRKGAVYVAQAEAAARLRVVPCIERLASGDVLSLLVDAEALVTDPHDVRFWRLYPTFGEQWGCAGAGTEGPLSELLRGIADSYLDRPALAGGDDPEEATDG